MLYKFLLAAVVSVSVLSTATSFAADHLPADPPQETVPRTYKSAQGTLDIEKLEALLSSDLGSRIKVVSIRWTGNPLAYVAYAGGYLVNLVDPTEGPRGEYTLTIQNPESHVAKCTLSLRTVNQTGSISSCISETAKISTYIDFDFVDLGLPMAPAKPKF